VPATVNRYQEISRLRPDQGNRADPGGKSCREIGLETLAVIEERPERLCDVEGIGSKRIEMIRTAWEEQKGIKEIMIFLQGHGVSAAYSARIISIMGAVPSRW